MNNIDNHFPNVTQKDLQQYGCKKEKPCIFEIIIHSRSKDRDGIDILLNNFLNNSESSILIKPIYLPFDQWYERFKNGQFDMYYAGANLPYPDGYFFLRYLLDENIYPGIKRLQILQLLTESLKVNNKFERGKLYQKIDESLMEQLGIFPIYHGDRPTRHIPPNISGYELPIMGYPYLKIYNLQHNL